MNAILSTAQEALIAFFLLLPIFCYLNKRRFISNRQTLLYLLFATYMTGVYAVVGLPDIAYYRFSPNINLEPFLYMYGTECGSVPSSGAFSSHFVGRFLLIVEDRAGGLSNQSDH